MKIRKFIIRPLFLFLIISIATDVYSETIIEKLLYFEHQYMHNIDINESQMLEIMYLARENYDNKVIKQINNMLNETDLDEFLVNLVSLSRNIQDIQKINLYLNNRMFFQICSIKSNNPDEPIDYILGDPSIWLYLNLDEEKAVQCNNFFIINEQSFYIIRKDFVMKNGGLGSLQLEIKKSNWK
ncbi:hypothetical protein GF406_06490 [candidate division KSB1 bacterium]|nr:hypothetical protein [candidate division KSB1 bacterium]